jgi:hypothetical protein
VNDPERLIDAYLDDELTEEQAHQLEDVLLNDADFLQLFLARTCEHRLLHVTLTGQASIAERTAEAIPRPALPAAPALDAAVNDEGGQWSINKLARQIDWGRHPLYFAATVAVLTLTAWLVFATLLGPFRPNNVDLAEQKDTASQGFVARLTAVNSARWDTAAPRGPNLTAGQELQLTEGLAQIEFASGARVILEGPTTFVVQDENSGRLALGKLVAKVSQSAVGFTVDTPSSRIVDLGTEFGVEAAEDGEGMLDVMQGSVELFLRQPAGTRQGKSTVLAAGETVRVVNSRDGRFQAIAIDTVGEPRFARSMPADSLAQRDVLTMRMAAADARMTAAATGAKHGSGTLLSVHTVGRNVQRTVLKFNITDLPTQAQIKSAELILFASRADNKAGSEMQVYRLVSPWIEQHVTWRNRHAKTSWPVPGGDGVGRSGRPLMEPYASSTRDPANGAAARWEVTDLVRQWHLGKHPNHGLLLLSRGENRLSFHSREAPDHNLRPRLVIQYQRVPPKEQPQPPASDSVAPIGRTK